MVIGTLCTRSPQPHSKPADNLPLVSVVLPCLNEEQTIGTCIKKIQDTFRRIGIYGEIIVCDNGSVDKSAEIAKSLSAHLVYQPRRGYGNAYLKGFRHAKGLYLVMADADDTYDLNQIPDFLDKLINENYDFVTGTRYLNGYQDKSMPTLHRYIGNPLLTAILNRLFGTNYTDVYCGFRAFTRRAYDRIEPISPGMEFNLELAINAGRAKLKIAEIPTKLHPRKGESKLRTFSDGWRSLKMMLLYCPNTVFLWPGLTLLVLGILTHLIVLLRLVHHQGRTLSTPTAVFATIFSVVGFQILSIGLHAKTYSWSRRFDRLNHTLIKFYRHTRLEVGLLLGLVMVLIGIILLSVTVVTWLQSKFSLLSHPDRVALAATFIIIGFNVIFTSLFISAMSMKRPK
ncbi:MAG: glycosyltransferase family 2 protein [Planctomycetes bacterium]|nr:glycosyltransferase family 2 protein [Planctomycetota bacterium]